jgi:hypothetical protein
MLTGAPAGYCRADPCRSIFLFTAFSQKRMACRRCLRLTPCGVRDRRSKFLERDDELNANDGFNLVQLEGVRIRLRSVETAWYSGEMRMLRLWIEAQPTLVIVLVVFGIAYLFAALVFVLASMVPSSWLHHFKQISAATVTALAVVLGVLLGFLAARVWANFDRAILLVGQEAGALTATMIFAETFPPEIKGRVRDAVLGHVKSAVEDEWPAMARREGIAAVPPPSLREALATILGFNPTRPGEELAQKSALAALEQAIEARRSRISLSAMSIDRTQWRVIMVLYALIIVTVAMARRATGSATRSRYS